MSILKFDRKHLRMWDDPAHSDEDRLDMQTDLFADKSASMGVISYEEEIGFMREYYDQLETGESFAGLKSFIGKIKASEEGENERWVTAWIDVAITTSMRNTYSQPMLTVVRDGNNGIQEILENDSTPHYAILGCPRSDKDTYPAGFSLVESPNNPLSEAFKDFILDSPNKIKEKLNRVIPLGQ